MGAKHVCMLLGLLLIGSVVLELFVGTKEDRRNTSEYDRVSYSPMFSALIRSFLGVVLLLVGLTWIVIESFHFE